MCRALSVRMWLSPALNPKFQLKQYVVIFVKNNLVLFFNLKYLISAKEQLLLILFFYICI